MRLSTLIWVPHKSIALVINSINFWQTKCSKSIALAARPVDQARPSQARSGQGSPPSPLARSVPVEDSACFVVGFFFGFLFPFDVCHWHFLSPDEVLFMCFFFVFAAALAGHGMPDRGRGGGVPPVDCPFYEQPLPLPAPLCMLTLYQMGLKSD